MKAMGLHRAARAPGKIDGVGQRGSRTASPPVIRPTATRRQPQRGPDVGQRDFQHEGGGPSASDPLYIISVCRHFFVSPTLYDVKMDRWVTPRVLDAAQGRDRAVSDRAQRLHQPTWVPAVPAILL